MSQAGQLQTSDPQAAAHAWAKMDREITYLAPGCPSPACASPTSPPPGQATTSTAHSCGILLNEP